MQYRRDKKGNELSVLGYGCMRFTKNGSSVDLDKAEKEVMAAIKAGVNYFDTAYVYAGNEATVGEILDRNHCREQIYLATKLPHYLIKSVAGAEKMFQEELRRLKTDYIDYYLMHMLTDIPTWEKLKKIGMQDWIEEKLASGQIRNIGFSYHGNTEMFKQLWMPTTGISARSSTTIWMNTHRQAWKDCAMQMQKDFRSSSWSLFAEADW